MLNLQNKGAMKTDMTLEILHLFIHAQCMLKAFSRRSNKCLKVCLLHGSDPGCCGYGVALVNQGRIRYQICAVGETSPRALRAAVVSRPGMLLPEHAWQVTE